VGAPERRTGGSGLFVPRAHAERGGALVVVEADRLAGSEEGLAVTIRAATPGEGLEFIARAPGLSARERELARLVVAGLDTAVIARRLGISRHTGLSGGGLLCSPL
jgi:hypothetical protein